MEPECPLQNPYSLRLYVTLPTYWFIRWRVVTLFPRQEPSWRSTPCQMSVTAYSDTRSCSPYVGAVTLNHAVVELCWRHRRRV